MSAKDEGVQCKQSKSAGACIAGGTLEGAEAHFVCPDLRREQVKKKKKRVEMVFKVWDSRPQTGEDLFL